MLARWRDPRVVPIEIWDLFVGEGTPLHRVARDDTFGVALARAVERLVAGTATSESGVEFPALCKDIRRVVLAGGAANDIRWPSAFPAIVADEPARVADRGGAAVLQRAGSRAGVVVDLGQSRLKVVTAQTRVVRERDLARIPLRAGPHDRRARHALVDFVATTVRSVAPPTTDAFVIALPCEVSDDGTLGPCSYPWDEGDGTLASELVAALRHPAASVWLLNDAELAAIGVAEDSPAEITLVITLGFGVGAAIVRAADF